MTNRYCILIVLLFLSNEILVSQTTNPYKLKAIDKTADYLCHLESGDIKYTPFKKGDIIEQEHITKQVEEFKLTNNKSFIEFLLLKKSNFTTLSTRQKLTVSKDLEFINFVDSIIIKGLLGNAPARAGQDEFKKLKDTLQILIREEDLERNPPISKEDIPISQDSSSSTPDQIENLNAELNEARESGDFDSLSHLISKGKKEGSNDKLIEEYEQYIRSYNNFLEKGKKEQQNNFKKALHYYYRAQSAIPTEEINSLILTTEKNLQLARSVSKKLKILLLISGLIILSISGFVIFTFRKFSKKLSEILNKVKIENRILTNQNLQKNKLKKLAKNKIWSQLGNISSLVSLYESSIVEKNRENADLKSKNAVIEKVSTEQVQNLTRKISNLESDRSEKPTSITDTHKPLIQEFPKIRYAIGPEDGGFPNEKLKWEKTQKSIFKVTLHNNSSGTFEILNDKEALDYALNNEIYILKPACDYENSSANGPNIKMLRKGRLQKSGEAWVIEEKAVIEFY